MIKFHNVFLVASCCMSLNFFGASQNIIQGQPLSHLDSFSNLNSLSRSNSATSLADELISSATSKTEESQGVFSGLNSLKRRVKDMMISNRSYLEGHDEEGSLLEKLKKEPVTVQNIFNSAFDHRFDTNKNPAIEDSENQRRLATIIAIGKKYSHSLAAPTTNYDSDDSDDATPLPRTMPLSQNNTKQPITKLQLADNLAQRFLPGQQEALLKKLKQQKEINAQLIATKRLLFEQASAQESTTKQTAAQDEQKTLEAIDAERNIYMTKWEEQTAAALQLKNDTDATALSKKQESCSTAEQYYNGQIIQMKTTASIIAANLRYIKTKADGEITIPHNAHKKANYVTSEQYLKILDSIE